MYHQGMGGKRVAPRKRPESRSLLLVLICGERGGQVGRYNVQQVLVLLSAGPK